MFNPFAILNMGHRPESYTQADKDPRTGRALDVGLRGLERPGNAKHSDGFFEKGLLKAMEGAHTPKGGPYEVKVVANGHCHGTLRGFPKRRRNNRWPRFSYRKL